jgi:hypothetical protein
MLQPKATKLRLAHYGARNGKIFTGIQTTLPNETAHTVQQQVMKQWIMVILL